MGVFVSLFTLFTLLGGGYFAKRIGFLKQKQSRTFLDFAIIFALPCLIFDRMYHYFKKLISFPPFIALVSGFALKFVALPEFLFAPIRAFGGVATTIAFAIGVGLSFSAIKSAYKSTALVVFAKMILAPLIFIFLLWLFNFEFSKSVVVAIIESATPTMTIAAALIMKAKLDSNLAVSSVAFGILVCFANMSVLSLVFT